MDRRICISKKNTYIGLLIIFIFLVVLLSTLALKSNQANNSRASEIKNEVQLLPTAGPPDPGQLSQTNIYSVSRDSNGNIELLGAIPQITENKVYSIYMHTIGSWVQIDTFIATTKNIGEKFTTFWNPKNAVSVENAQTGIFYLFKVN